MESKHTDQAKAKAKLSMMHSKVVCCKLYISESQNAMVVDAISHIGQKDPDVVLLSKFKDEYYNRVRYTLVSYIIRDSSTGEVVFSPIRKVLLAMIEAAFSAINLEVHRGTHPRIGVVDDISFHPLSQAAIMEDAAQLAKLVASDIGNGLQVPVFLYAAAHPSGKSVSLVRRELGYYRPNHKGIQWAGQVLPDILPMKPDVGPTHVSRERGATMVGAKPFVESYNVPILCKDVPTVRRITRRITGRSGGFPTVQALALFHGDNCTEIACFLDPDHVGADQVQWLVEQIAEEQGLEVDKGYFTDLSRDIMLERNHLVDNPQWSEEDEEEKTQGDGEDGQERSHEDDEEEETHSASGGTTASQPGTTAHTVLPAEARYYRQPRKSVLASAHFSPVVTR